jgi:hypothetical protein
MASDGKKEYRKLRKLLVKAGFQPVRENSHCIFTKDGVEITVARAIRNHRRIFETAKKQHVANTAKKAELAKKVK